MMVSSYSSLFSGGKIPTGSVSKQAIVPQLDQSNLLSGITGLSSSNAIPQFSLPLGTSTPASTTSSAFDTAASTSISPSFQQIASILSVIIGALANSLRAQQSNTPAPTTTASGDATPAAKTDNNNKTSKSTTSQARQGAQPANDTSPPKGTGNTGVADGKGWASNVNVFTSSNKDQESVGYYSNDQLVGGYMADLEKNMDKGQTLKEAHDNVKLDNDQTPMRNNANNNSLVPGAGGKAVVVTGDNISKKEADQFADHLKKDYGMDVQVIGDATPDQLKAAVADMGKSGGKQAMVAVLAHGAKDDSGNANGNMALGKGNDPSKQWLSEDDLKSMVNNDLAGQYDNVNVVVSSCFSGNFVQ